MKFLKALLLIVTIMVGIWVVLCAVGPTNMNTIRTTTIDAPASMVYAEVVDFKNWEAWSPWEGQDTTMVTTYEGADKGEGAIMKWTSQQMGGGMQTLTEAVENESIKTTLTFTDWEGESKADWTFNETDGKTEVSWSMESSEFPFMARGIMLLMGGNASLEEDYDKGLAALKEVVESKPMWAPMSEMVEDMWYLGIERDNLTMADLQDGQAHGPAYQALSVFMAENEIASAGMPICLSRRYSEESMDLTFAIPIVDSIAAGDGMIVGKIPAGKLMYDIHYGPYNGVADTWNKFDPWFEQNPTQMRYYPYEQYVNDPMTVSDPSEIQTKIAYPVEG